MFICSSAHGHLSILLTEDFLFSKSFSDFYELHIWFGFKDSDQPFLSLLSVSSRITTLYGTKSTSQKSSTMCRAGFSFNRAQLLLTLTLPPSKHTHACTHACTHTHYTEYIFIPRDINFPSHCSLGRRMQH